MVSFCYSRGVAGRDHEKQGMAPEELKRKRERLGLTQAELAKRLGIAKLTVLRYENGQTPIPRIVELALKEIERER